MNIQENLKTFGFVFLEGFEPEKSTACVASKIGKPWTGVEEAKPHTLQPKEKSLSTPNTYSGNFGLSEFPLHTDLAHWRKPPRYLALRCQVGTPDVATLLLDGQPIIQKFGRTLLSRALVQPRRPVQGRLPLLRLYKQLDDGSGMLRWDSLFIKPASVTGNQAYDVMKAEVGCAQPFSTTLKDPGDTLIIDNWRILHGRSAVPAGNETRVIERMYLEEVN